MYLLVVTYLFDEPEPVIYYYKLNTIFFILFLLSNGHTPGSARLPFSFGKKQFLKNGWNLSLKKENKYKV